MTIVSHFQQLNLACKWIVRRHYNDVIMSTMASQIASLTVVYSTVYSGADQRKHQRSASLAILRVIHRRPVNTPHKGPVARKMFPFGDVIMACNKTSCSGICFIDYKVETGHSRVDELKMELQRKLPAGITTSF